MLTGLLLQLSRSCRVESAATEAPGAQLVQRLMDYMVSHSAEVTLESLSEAFHYHPNTVASVLKKGAGKTFSQLLFQTRMSHAAQLLTHSRLSIREIAEQRGYSNTSYFYSRFHQSILRHDARRIFPKGQGAPPNHSRRARSKRTVCFFGAARAARPWARRASGLTMRTGFAIMSQRGVRAVFLCAGKPAGRRNAGKCFRRFRHTTVRRAQK